MQTPSITIAVQGATHGLINTPEVLEIAERIGSDIAERSLSLAIGSPSGFPLWAARSARQGSGHVIGFSPAASAYEHEHVHRLPLGNVDIMIYTGMGKASRNVIMTRTAAGIIFGPGGLDTVQEFTIALQESKPIGVLTGPWSTDEAFAEILSAHPEYNHQVIFDNDPHRLLDQVISHIHTAK